MAKHNGDGVDGSDGDADGVQPGVDVFQFLRDNRFEKKEAWIKIEEESQNKGDTAAEKPKSESAKRKAKQRESDPTVKECYAKTANDADVRALVSAVATGIVGQPIVRAAMWLAIRNPDIVFLGDQVSRFGHIWRILLRAMIWCSGVSTSWPAAIEAPK